MKNLLGGFLSILTQADSDFQGALKMLVLHNTFEAISLGCEMKGGQEGFPLALCPVVSKAASDASSLLFLKPTQCSGHSARPLILQRKI